jgi:hypothetical protein
LTITVKTKDECNSEYIGVTHYELVPDGITFKSLDLKFENGSSLSIPFIDILNWNVKETF